MRDSDVKVIVLRGAGRSFCGGFDFGGGFHQWDETLAPGGGGIPGGSSIATVSPQLGWVPKFNSLWTSVKPVIAMVHGWCVGGGSEMALSADIVLMSEDARIGTPYSRLWGCHHAGMWVHRLGLARAKELALTGRALSGVEAADIGLVNAAYPFAELEGEAYALAERLCTIPLSQLAAMKLIVNQAYENMGLRSTQFLGSLLDGMLRNTPEALRFVRWPRPTACAPRWPSHDPFGDYSRGPQEGKPDPPTPTLRPDGPPGQGRVVTGGGGGIGSALATARSRRAPPARGRRPGLAGAAGHPGRGLRRDLGGDTRALIARAEAELGPVDVFFANAGVTTGVDEQTDGETWDTAFAVNMLAHVRAARLLVPGWLERGAGYFVATASAAGLLTQIGRRRTR